MKKSNALTRRGFLRGPGAFTLALPYLASLPVSWRHAHAQMGAAPKRLVMFCTPHPPKEQHVPKGVGRNFSLPETHKGLAEFKDQSIFISNISMLTSQDSNGNPHAQASAQILTGEKSGSGDGLKALGPSVDQFIAKNTPQAAIRSLEAGVLGGDGGTNHNFIVKGASGENIPYSSDPGQVYERLFKDFNPGNSGGPTQAMLDSVERRTSVVDHVLKDYQSLRIKLNRGDQDRIDLHMDSLRELETEISKEVERGNSSSSSACFLPGEPNLTESSLPRVSALQFKNLALGLICDRSRVMTLQCQGARTGQTFDFLGLGNQGLHGISHNDATGARLTRVRQWFSGEIANFLTDLQNATDVDGNSVFDNTLFVWFGEIGSAADKHIKDDHVFTLIGGKNMGLDLGQHINGGGRGHNDVLTTVIKAMGLSDRTFGGAKYNKGPFDEAFIT